MKWYKNGKEFFRIMPSMSPHTKVDNLISDRKIQLFIYPQLFFVTGVSVDKSACDLSRLVMTNVTRASAGVYRY